MAHSFKIERKPGNLADTGLYIDGKWYEGAKELLHGLINIGDDECHCFKITGKEITREFVDAMELVRNHDRGEAANLAYIDDLCYARWRLAALEILEKRDRESA